MNKPAVIALVITLLDAMGIGLIMPVLPSLLREYLPEADVANHYGILLALYAVMQVCFAPLLGRWSDKLGRRPVLLLSLAGAAFDYTLLALSNVLWMLYLGRIISGITGATGAVAASVVADSTAVSERTAWFGRLGAAFGAGLIAGPAIGGLAGDISPHLPFVIAAILNACTFLMVFFIFKPAVQTEEKPAEQKQESAGISFITLLKPLALLLFVFFTAQLIGQIPATVWVLFTESRFAWDSAAVGFSLAGLGAMHALFQAVVAGMAKPAKWTRYFRRIYCRCHRVFTDVCYHFRMDGVSGPDPAGRRRNCTACIAGHYLCRGIGGKSGKTTGCAGQPDQSDRRGGPAAVCFYFQSDTAECGRYGVADWHGTVEYCWQSVC